jgi:hypothetical protein
VRFAGLSGVNSPHRFHRVGVAGLLVALLFEYMVALRTWADGRSAAVAVASVMTARLGRYLAESMLTRQKFYLIIELLSGYTE